MDNIHVEDDKSKEPVLTDDTDKKDDPDGEDDPDSKDKAANQANPFSDKGIEGDENDPCEQIAFMEHGLSDPQKRRTMSLLQPEFEPLLTSTVLGGKQDDVSPA